MHYNVYKMEIYFLGRKIFNERIANIAVIIYCFIFSNLFAPLHSLSDHPSYFLALSGLCLALSKKWYYIALAGVCYAISYTFRPTVMAFVVCSIIYLFANRNRFTSYVYLLIPYIFLLTGIGICNKARIGHCVNTSSLAGYGLAHSANPETTFIQYGDVYSKRRNDKFRHKRFNMESKKYPMDKRKS